jgi:hypothetical protein
MDTRNMYSDFAVNKYLHTVASCWILLTYRESCFGQDLYVCGRPSSRVLWDSTRTVQVNCNLWSKTQYFHSPACFHGVNGYNCAFTFTPSSKKIMCICALQEFFLCIFHLFTVLSRITSHVSIQNINNLRTKSNEFYLKTQSVPRSKHLSPQL